MRRITLFGLAILFGTALPAQAATEITRFVFGSGGGVVASAQHSVNFTLGQDVVGVSGSPQTWVGHGFWTVPNAVSHVLIPEDSPQPLQWNLYGNVPNPFNPRTVIKFDVPPPGGVVRLFVYDARGRRIRTLWDGPVQVGSRQIAWIGRDDAGRAVSSGLYFMVLETPEEKFTRKMTLVR